MSQLRLQIASDIIRDDLFAEIYYGDQEELLAEVSQKTGEAIIYPRPNGEPYRVSLSELQVILRRAHEELYQR